MTIAFCISTVPPGKVQEMMPTERISVCDNLTPGATMNDPHLIAIESRDASFAALVLMLRQVNGVTALPHPQSKSPFDDGQLAAVQQVHKTIGRGAGLRDLLLHAHTKTGSAYWHPDLHCF